MRSELPPPPRPGLTGSRGRSCWWGAPTPNTTSASPPRAKNGRTTRGGRLPPEWRQALKPLGTDWAKPFLETAPWLVIVFEQRYGVTGDGDRVHNYYVKESVGIACGLFIAALHRIGLVTLTHTPSPMAFLTRLLDRPANERPFILFPVGYPAEGTEVPDLTRKPLDEVMVEVPAAK